MQETKTAVKYDWFGYLPQFSLEHNAAVIGQQMQEARKDLRAKGYRFIFNQYEWSTHAAARSGFQKDCWEMARASRDDRKSVRIFRNMNGEIIAELEMEGRAL